MSAHRYMSLSIIALLFLAGIAAGTQVSAETCPAGTVAITPATRAAATSAGIPITAQCWQPSDSNTGQAAGEAKAYLAQHATKNSNISCLNADYAVKLAKLMQAVPGGAPTITDGYRSPQAQANLPAGSTQVGACGSYHQYGMAADFNNASKTTLLWMRIHAPEYGLTRIPALSIVDGCSLKGTGFCDPAHIQINAPLPPKNQCGICATNGSSGNGMLPATGPVPSVPDDIQYYNQSQTAPVYAPSIPSAPITSTPVATTPAATTNPATTQSPTTTGICSPAFSCSNSVMYYQTTSCTTQVYQNCAHGCSGNSCAFISPTTGTSTLIATTTSTQASSTEDLLNAFANPISITTAPIGSATSIAVALNGDTSGDVTQLATDGSTGTIVNPGTITSIQPISAQQTFTTTDLSGNAYVDPARSTSSVLKILSDLKAALVWALSILNPFAAH